MTPSKPTALILLLLAGCTVSVAPPAGVGRSTAPRAKVSAKPVAVDVAGGSAGPSTAPVASLPSVGPSLAPAISAKPPLSALKIPTRILPDLPASLVAAGGGNLVGPDGASLVGPDGASLIGPDGGSLIGMDGASYALAQFAAPSPGATCAPPDIPLTPGKLIKDEFRDFVQTCRTIEKLLADASALGLQPGVPMTDKRPGMGGREVSNTFLLEQRGEGGLLTVADGETITPDNTLVTLAFMSTETGEAVYRLKNAELGFTLGMHVVFDHGKGDVSSDFVMKLKFPGMEAFADAPPLLARRQLKVTKLPAGGPDSPTTRLVSGSVANQGRPPCDDSRVALAIHYLPDGRAAMQIAQAKSKGTPLVFLGLDGVRAAEPGPGTGFFVDNDEDGTYLAGDATLAQLGPALPTKDQMPANLPPLPDLDDPLADPAFNLLK